MESMEAVKSQGIRILTVKRLGSYSNKTKGEYFEFDKDDFLAEFHQSQGTKYCFYGKNSRTQRQGLIAIWEKHHDFKSGKPTGRWEPYENIQPYDWQVGDEIWIEPICTVKKLGYWSKYTNGEYFEFDVNDFKLPINKGRNQITGFYGFNHRSQRWGKIVVWYNHTDFKSGQPNGRWEPYSNIRAEDWKIGDKIYPLKLKKLQQNMVECQIEHQIIYQKATFESLFIIAKKSKNMQMMRNLVKNRDYLKQLETINRDVEIMKNQLHINQQSSTNDIHQAVYKLKYQY